MKPITRHVYLPALAPLAIVGLYFTPLTVIGCATRGLIALAIALVSLVAGLVTAVVALRARGRPVAMWWITTTLILALPALLVLGPLG